MRLGKLLRLYRVFEGREQKDMAAEIGVGNTVLSRIENGRTCDMKTLGKLIIWLLEDDDGKKELVKG
jgi:transcriptional regulator with XRE-family HTH domain